ncbi:hypothetical protein L6452_42435 [Arctium lappa]|uniref:Uncharacterized protein n=1 Tax=Arctium lappa TaxID=4217 RepID=A0ACB8XIX5_ARCLA|nr:hypothetical protein L6452_42435 [Arctium lappa]
MCNETLLIWGARTIFRLENNALGKWYAQVTVVAYEVAVAVNLSRIAHALRIDATTHLIFLLNQLTLLSFSSSTTSLSVENVDGDDEVEHRDGVTHHSITQVLKNFNKIRFLKIEISSGDLGIEDDVLLTWRDDFGSTL